MSHGSRIVKGLHLAVISAVALSLGVAASNAVQAGVYLGAGVGQSKMEDGSCADAIALGFTSCTSDESATGFRIFGGYSFTRNFAIEVGYNQFGTFGAAVADGFGTVSAELDASGFDLSVVGTIPVNEQFSLFGTLGFVRWDADTSFVGTGVYAGTGSDSDSGTDPKFGFGARFDATKAIGIRAGWEFLDLDDTDANRLYADIVFHIQ